MVRTTLNLDEDVLGAVRSLAAAQRRGLGAVVSDLVRRGLQPPAPRIRAGKVFPTFDVPKGATIISDEAVREALDEE